MSRKPLLELTSATYLRRLAKELNALTDGFYFDGIRYTRASVSVFKEVPMIRFTRTIYSDSKRTETESRGVTGKDLSVTDVYGREVCARRSV